MAGFVENSSSKTGSGKVDLCSYFESVDLVGPVKDSEIDSIKKIEIDSEKEKKAHYSSLRDVELGSGCWRGFASVNFQSSRKVKDFG